MVVQLIENLRAAILLNTFLNSTAALCCFVMLAIYLKDTRWKCVLLLCLLGPASAADPNYKLITVNPKATRDLETRTLSEVCSLITDKDYKYCLVDQFKKPVDVITVCHESTHMLDASLSVPGYQGIYLGSGHGISKKKKSLPSGRKALTLNMP